MNKHLKFNNAGTLDPAFADTGVLRFPKCDTTGIESTAVLALPDQKTLIGFYPAEFGEPATVVRLHENGALDDTFGEKGVAEISLENVSMAHVVGLSLLSDGGWLLFGTYQRASSIEGLAVVRCNHDGRQDHSFGEKGVRYLRFDQMDKPETPETSGQKSGLQSRKKVLSFRAAGVSSTHAVQQVDGKIVVVSNVFDEDLNSNGIVLRLNPNGSTDKTFNTYGFALVEFPNNSNTALGVTAQADGKILVCGKYSDDTPGFQGGYLSRFDASGRVDPTFNGGKTFTLKTRWEQFDAISVRESDGRIVVVGAAAPVGVLQGAIVVLNTNGSFNLVFNNGKPLYSPLQEAGVHWKRCLSQADGTVVVSGNGSIRYINGGDTCVVARYLSSGSLDPAFNEKGFVVFDDESLFCYYRDMSVMEDGRIVACGYYLVDDFNWVVVGGWAVRYLV